MRARIVNEKFTQDGDAIHDMGIGQPEYVKLQQAYKKLNDYINFDVEDLAFGEVIDTLDYLKRISAYTVANFFNQRYTFYVKINPFAGMGSNFATANIGNVTAKFSTSGPGKMIYITFWDNQGRRISLGTKPSGYGGWVNDIYAEANARSIHSLHDKFKHMCKRLEIDLSKYTK